MTGELPTDYTFQGRRDSGWGLMHFGARWLDSNSSSFDPLGNSIEAEEVGVDLISAFFRQPVRFWGMIG